MTTVKKYSYFDKDGNLLGSVRADDYYQGIKKEGINPELVDDFDVDEWDEED